MNRRISEFQQDAELQWVALLECGHRQHVRHDPPWQYRPWVLEETSRRERLGSVLDCPMCDNQTTEGSGAVPGAADAPDAYEDARLRGLCHDGAAEVARRAGSRRPRDRAPE